MGFNPIGALSSAVSSGINAVQDGLEAVGDAAGDVVESITNTVQDGFDDSGEMGPIAGIQGCCDNGAENEGFV